MVRSTKPVAPASNKPAADRNGRFPIAIVAYKFGAAVVCGALLDILRIPV